jgi:hypothetical protein
MQTKAGLDEARIGGPLAFDPLDLAEGKLVVINH